MYLPSISFPVTQCAPNLIPHVLTLNGNSRKGGAQPENTVFWRVLEKQGM